MEKLRKNGKCSRKEQKNYGERWGECQPICPRYFVIPIQDKRHMRRRQMEIWRQHLDDTGTGVFTEVLLINKKKQEQEI